MSQLAWPEQVATLSAMLNTLESQVGRGDLSTPGLAEFKSVLDDLRLRTWSLLTATNADDPHAFQERFRTHRGTEMCRALSTDLRTGKLSGRQPDLPVLGAAARDLSAAVKKATESEATMPFKSKAQRRKFAELLVNEDISEETYEEWNRSTGSAHLPERLHPAPRRKVKKRKSSTRPRKAASRSTKAGSKKATRAKASAKGKRRKP